MKCKRLWQSRYTIYFLWRFCKNELCALFSPGKTLQHRYTTFCCINAGRTFSTPCYVRFVQQCLLDERFTIGQTFWPTINTVEYNWMCCISTVITFSWASMSSWLVSITLVKYQRCRRKLANTLKGFFLTSQIWIREILMKWIKDSKTDNCVKINKVFPNGLTIIVINAYSRDKYQEVFIYDIRFCLRWAKEVDSCYLDGCKGNVYDNNYNSFSFSRKNRTPTC